MVVLLLVGHLVMPSNVAGHERNTLALVGVGHNTFRLAFYSGLNRQGLANLIHVVAVDLFHGPAKSIQFWRQRRKVVGVGQRRALLKAVVVDDQCQVVEFELRCGHDGLPV